MLYLLTRLNYDADQDLKIIEIYINKDFVVDVLMGATVNSVWYGGVKNLRIEFRV